MVNCLKLKRLVALLTLVAIIAAIVVLAGCGNGVDAKQILVKSGESMGKIKTAKFQMDMEMDAGEGQSTKATYMVEEVLDDPEGIKLKVTQKMEMDTGEGKEEQETEMYLVGNTAYMLDPTSGEWLKQEGISPQAVLNTMGMGSVSELKDSLKYAEDAKVTSEDTDSYTISCAFGDKFYKDYMLKSVEGMEDTPEYEEYLKAIEEMEAPTMTMTMKVDKKTDYVTEVDGTITMKGEGTPEGGGESTTKIKSKLLEYNKPIEIVLPEEAKNAKSWSESQPEEPQPEE